MSVVVKHKSDLKKQVMNFKGIIITPNQKIADPLHLGIHILTKVIPVMDKMNEVAFAWHWRAEDVCVYNQEEYQTETNNYVKNHKMKKVDGDTEWFYVFKNKDGKMRKATITTEIWFNKSKDWKLSPIAVLLAQWFGAGLHICKVKFEDA